MANAGAFKKGEKKPNQGKRGPNKATAKRQAEVAASGLTPLDYLLSVMRNEALEVGQRVDAGKAAALYVHPKLQPVDGKTGSAEVQAKVSVEFIGSAARGV